jgi:hypothetical protein
VQSYPGRWYVIRILLPITPRPNGGVDGDVIAAVAAADVSICGGIALSIPKSPAFNPRRT